MSKRLIDTYKIGDMVEIRFSNAPDWLPAQVTQHDPPGVWVRTIPNGRSWFLTNTRRIRKKEG